MQVTDRNLYYFSLLSGLDIATLSDHTEGVVSVTGDGMNTIITASFDGSAKIWDSRTFS